MNTSTPESWDELADAVLTHDRNQQRRVWHPHRIRANVLYALDVVRGLAGTLLDYLTVRVPDVRPVTFDQTEHDRVNATAEAASVHYADCACAPCAGTRERRAA